MNLTINIEDENLTKAINEGVKELPKETIRKISEAAFAKYFESASDVFENLLFKKTNYYSKEKEPSDFFLNIMKDFITDEDVKPIKDAIINYILQNNAELVHKILLEAIINLIGAYDFKNAVANSLMSISMNEIKIQDYINSKSSDFSHIINDVEYKAKDIIDSQHMEGEKNV